MASWSKRADLGRTEPWLRAVAFAVWSFIGVSRLWPARSALWASGSAPAWVLPWLAYGAALCGAGLHRQLPRWVRVLLLALQSAAVAMFTKLGLRGFEGLFMSIVAVQVPTVLSLAGAIVWTLVQVPLLLAIVFPLRGGTDMMDIVGAYSSFSAFAMLVYWLHEQESKARQALARANADLLSTRALVIDGARQSERLRISRELHDSLGHHLIAISIQLELAEQFAQGSAALPVRRAKDISREALGEVRRVVAAMQSGDGPELIATLKTLAAGIPAPRIHVQGNEALHIADRELGHALFRCVQEAITNSLKHAGASNIWVEVGQSAEHLELQVRDDGKGAHEVSPGTGLQGIRTRILQLGGSADFHAHPGAGFTVRIAVPLAEGGR